MLSSVYPVSGSPSAQPPEQCAVAADSKFVARDPIHDPHPATMVIRSTQCSLPAIDERAIGHKTDENDEIHLRCSM
jgi:hypothetical protein